MLFTRIHKCLKQSHSSLISVPEIFRMPLHSQEEIRVIRLFNSLDNTVRSNRRNYQFRCWNMHTLVMAAVYSNLGLTVADGVKESILCNIHPVTWDIIVKRLLVCDRKFPFCLGWDILIQTSTKAYI